MCGSVGMADYSTVPPPSSGSAGGGGGGGGVNDAFKDALQRARQVSVPRAAAAAAASRAPPAGWAWSWPRSHCGQRAAAGGDGGFSREGPHALSLPKRGRRACLHFRTAASPRGVLGPGLPRVGPGPFDTGARKVLGA